jgi:hypothetical protein
MGIFARVAPALIGLGIGASARAADVETGTFVPRPVAGFELLELRGGVQASEGSGHAMMCVELDSPWIIGVDTCGSGGGFLYPQPPDVDEMVHFRLEGTVPVHDWGRAEVFVQPGVGFAEIEHGADQPGFLFGAARSPDQREGAGAEGAVSAKIRAWPHERFYLTGELTGGVGYIPSAPVVLDQQSAWVPFGVGSLGIGF